MTQAQMSLAQEQWLTLTIAIMRQAAPTKAACQLPQITEQALQQAR